MRPVVVGKNILDILTTGMYKDARVILREFVQNSADSLERAISAGVYRSRSDLPPVQVHTNQDDQTLVVEDEGVGVPAAQAWAILTSLADSQKDRGTELGFRGIGRLAGLAYCQRMTIETCARGEDTKTRLVWDAEKLRTLIHDRSYRCTAEEVVQQVTTLTNADTDTPGRSYYKVTLEGVDDDALLDPAKVKEYLSHVAPVPFLPSFYYSGSIKDHLKKAGLNIREYRIFVDNDQVFKPYRTRVYEETADNERAVAEIVNIGTENFHVGTELAAVCWYSIMNPLQLIKVCNPLGIRPRAGNIQVGDRFSLQQLFSDTRFHKYFLGELHVMSNRCVPNGQRDYFEDTPEFRELEKGFRAFALSLEKLCRKASDISSSFKKIESHELARKQFEAKDGGGAFIGPDERREAQAEVTKKAADAEAAQEKIDSILDPSQGGNVEVLKALAKKQEDTIRERLEAARPKPEVSSPGEDTEQRSGSRRYLTSQLSDLNRRERKLVSRVYAIIKQVLPYDVAENLVAKIQEDLKISAKEGT